ncbi:MAG: hypothetical protein AMS27_17225, partial [Bacteroides sp. SM23_62_1]
MRRIIYICSIITILIFIFIYSCNKDDWEDHYSNYDEKVNMNLWTAVKEESRFSKFADWIEENNLDTIFDTGLSYTLFIPNNEAIEAFHDTTGYPVEKILLNHISQTVFQTRNIDHNRKLQTMSGKFALIERTIDGFSFDEHPIIYTSPLYLDGKVYEISEVAFPRPNLYEFTSLFSSVIKKYIDEADSIYLDKINSKPIGFDEYGNTIYDSTFGTVNRFERDFFPVSQEFRDKSATFILFTQVQYNEALNMMAANLGPGFTSKDDIPMIWQDQVLLPDMMAKSLFYGIIDYSEFKNSMVSITGDTVVIDPYNIDPSSKFLCSNGQVFTYLNFIVPENLYKGNIIIEGEDLVDSIGAGKYAWKEGVTVTGLVTEPFKDASVQASQGALVNVSFPRNYTGEYNVEFAFTNVFPMKYRLEWRANYRPSGIFAVYINDLKLGEFDTYNLRSSVISVTGKRFIAVEGFNKKDWWVENIVDFGNISIRFEFLGPGIQSVNGFNIDYVA